MATTLGATSAEVAELLKALALFLGVVVTVGIQIVVGVWLVTHVFRGDLKRVEALGIKAEVSDEVGRWDDYEMPMTSGTSAANGRARRTRGPRHLYPVALSRGPAQSRPGSGQQSAAEIESAARRVVGQLWIVRDPTLEVRHRAEWPELWQALDELSGQVVKPKGPTDDSSPLLEP